MFLGELHWFIIKDVNQVRHVETRSRVLSWSSESAEEKTVCLEA